jgi:hypothetical protein
MLNAVNGTLKKNILQNKVGESLDWLFVYSRLYRGTI